MTSCKLCGDLTRRSATGIKVSFDCKPANLEKSVGLKCRICSLLRDSIACFEPLIGVFNDIRHIYVNGPLPNAVESLEMEIYFQDDRPKIVLEFFVEDGDQIHFESVKSRTRVLGNASSEISLWWVSEILERCASGHKHCKNELEAKLPTRILDLGDPAEDLSIRLCEPVSKNGRYACLSHCWGESRSITTETNTLKTRKNGIPFSSLPKTFRDVILFTRRLQIRYLWIDSLCILQDDKNDWIKESSSMASIFRNSYLTIAATAAVGDSEGCFSKSSPRSDDYKMTLETLTGAKGHIFVREKLDHFNDVQHSQAPNTIPLLSRAWVYQERLLSPRVLHICKHELVWECMQETVCQCTSMRPFPAPKQDHMRSLLNNHLPKPEITALRYQDSYQILRVRPSSESDPPYMVHPFRSSPPFFRPYYNLNDYPSAFLDSLVSRWHTIIEEYSGLELSVTNDRLPALAGLASQLSSYHEGGYLGGLWSDSLVDDLLWRVDGPSFQARKDRPAIERAPSWSWASMDAKVSYWPRGPRSDRLPSICCQVVEAVCRSNDKTDKTASGYLILSGLCTPATLVYGVGDSQQEQTHIRISGDWSGQRDYPFYADYFLDLCRPYHMGDEENLPWDFVCFILTIGEVTNFLVLRRLGKSSLRLRSDGNDIQTYKRIGIGKVGFSLKSGGFSREFKKCETVAIV